MQVLDARMVSGMMVTSKAVLSSSSAGLAGLSSTTSSNSKDTGRSSRYNSADGEIRSFPLAGSETRVSRRKVVKRYSNRIAIKMPRREYDGGLVYGL